MREATVHVFSTRGRDRTTYGSLPAVGESPPLATSIRRRPNLGDMSAAYCPETIAVVQDDLLRQCDSLLQC